MNEAASGPGGAGVAQEGFVAHNVEGPQIIRLCFTGLVDGPDGQKSAQACRDAFGDKPFAMMVETPKLKGLTPLARKVFAELYYPLPVVACALLRASLATRAVSTFIVAAINIFRRKQKMELGFYDDDEPARRWCEGVLSQRR